MTTTIQTCVGCCHTANVKTDCASWACAQCGRIQRTARIQCLYDLGMAFYRVCRHYTRMAAARYKSGNRTAEYDTALETLDHVRDYLWQSIRAAVIIDAVVNADGILDAAWKETSQERFADRAA